MDTCVVVDLEMTGLNFKTDRILEIGAVKLEEGNISSIFHRMVNPKMMLTEEIISRWQGII